MGATILDNIDEVVDFDNLYEVGFEEKEGELFLAKHKHKQSADINTERIVSSAQLLDYTDTVEERISYNSTTIISTPGEQNSSNFIKVEGGKRYYFKQPSGRRGIAGFSEKDNNTHMGNVVFPYSFGSYSFNKTKGMNYDKKCMYAVVEVYD